MYVVCVVACRLSQETVVKLSLARHIWRLSSEREIAQMYIESRLTSH
jgi:hypothetical protein